MRAAPLVLVALVLLLAPAAAGVPQGRAYFVVVDSKGNVVTGQVRLSVGGLPVYRLNSTHLYAPLGSERVVRLSVESWGVVVYSAEVEVRPGFTYEIRVPVADLEVRAPPGCRVTVTVLRSNRSATVEGSGVIRALPMGLVKVRVEYAGRAWEDVYDFTGGSLNVRENLSVEYSPTSLALLALSTLPTVAYLVAVKARGVRENRIPRPCEYGVPAPEEAGGGGSAPGKGGGEAPARVLEAEPEPEGDGGPLEGLAVDGMSLREVLEKVRA